MIVLMKLKLSEVAKHKVSYYPASTPKLIPNTVFFLFSSVLGTLLVPGEEFKAYRAAVHQDKSKNRIRKKYILTAYTQIRIGYKVMDVQ